MTQMDEFGRHESAPHELVSGRCRRRTGLWITSRSKPTRVVGTGGDGLQGLERPLSAVGAEHTTVK